MAPVCLQGGGEEDNQATVIQSRRLSIFGHVACMDDDADAKMMLAASP